MKVQLKVVEGDLECEVVSEIELQFELDVTETEFATLVSELGSNLGRVIYEMLKKRSNRIIIPAGMMK